MTGARQRVALQAGSQDREPQETVGGRRTEPRHRRRGAVWRE